MSEIVKHGDEADVLDVRRAAVLVGRHPETVRRWVWSGRLPARREGNRLVMARADVEALAADEGRGPTTLRAWMKRARRVRKDAGETGSGRSAAELVLADRASRSSLQEARAGR